LKIFVIKPVVVVLAQCLFENWLCIAWPNINFDYLEQLSIFQTIYFVLYLFMVHVIIAIVNKQLEKQS